MAYAGVKNLFWIAVILSIIAVVLDCIAFFTAYWIVSLPQYNSKFLNLGLWVACFNGYFHPQDYNGKLYYGCWWVFHPEYRYIINWLIPPWLWAFQWLHVVALIMHGVGLVTIVLYFMGHCARLVHVAKYILAICFIFPALVYLASLLLIGLVTRKDREWLPEPDHNTVGWSFWVGLVSCIASSLAGLFYLYLASLDHRDYFRAAADEANDKARLHASAV